MIQMLDAATKRGQFVPQNGKLVEPFSPIVLLSDKPLGDLVNRAGIEGRFGPPAKIRNSWIAKRKKNWRSNFRIAS